MTNPLYTIFPLVILFEISLYHSPHETMVVLIYAVLAGLAGLLLFTMIYLMADPDEL